MIALGPLLPLLIAAGILLAGNGLQGTLVTLRGAEEGFDAAFIGLMGTAYFGGFLVSCVISPRLLKAVGHIRVFAALAAIASSASLMLVLWIEPLVWILLRFVMGFCFSGLFMAVESWLNEASANKDRGRVLSIYRVVDLAVVTGSQFMLPLFGVGSFAIFALASIMISLSLVPVSLADRSSPKPPQQVSFDLKTIWSISPLACLGCITIGLTNSAFRTIGPLFGSAAGLDTAGIALFMSAGIIGGAVLQYPLGWMSDRLDRRYVFITATLGAAAAGFFLSTFAGNNPLLLYLGIFVFGAFSLPLYSLSAAHANDRASTGQYVLIAAGLSFFYSIGAAAGPLFVAWVMKIFGTSAFFTYTSIIHLLLVALTVWRMRARSRPERSSGRFTTLLRTSPVFFRLARSPSKKA